MCRQNPQCEGVHQTRILFNAKAPSLGRTFYTVWKEGEKYVLGAGAAHGITDGAEFDVYKDREWPIRSSPMGTLIAGETGAFTTTMVLPSNTTPFSLVEPAFALQTKAGTEEDLRLHISLDEKFTSIFEELGREMQRTGPDHRRILLVEKDRAELSITLERNHVVFDILNPLVTQFGLTRMPFRVCPNVDDIYPVIRASAHYHWHLRRTNMKKNLQRQVRIEFTKVIQLEEEYDGDFNPVVKPDGPNLNVGGVVRLVADPNYMYGIKLVNDTPLALYPSLFFFDNSDLSISEVPTTQREIRILKFGLINLASYYQPPTAGKFKVDAPLGPKTNDTSGSLAVGYGSGGSVPFTYFARDGQDVDVGFLKLFLTTEYVDFSNIPQSSPFNPDNRGWKQAQLKTVSTWDTIIIPVVQRRVPGVWTV